MKPPVFVVDFVDTKGNAWCSGHSSIAAAGAHAVAATARFAEGVEPLPGVKLPPEKVSFTIRSGR